MAFAQSPQRQRPSPRASSPACCSAPQPHHAVWQGIPQVAAGLWAKERTVPDPRDRHMVSIPMAFLPNVICL